MAGRGRVDDQNGDPAGLRPGADVEPDGPAAHLTHRRHKGANNDNRPGQRAASSGKQIVTAGDRLAEPISFDDVMRDHAGLFARIARSFEANAQKREDLLQDILLAVWRALPSFRQQSSLRTFVASVAHKRAVSHVRSHARQKTTELGDDIVDARCGR